MTTLIFASLIPLGFLAHFFQRRDGHRRIALLNNHLGKYNIEKLMATLIEGYMRALDEDDPVRQHLMLSMLSTVEKSLCEQFEQFAKEFALLDAELARSHKLPLFNFYSRRLFPRSTFDFRAALCVHARGISDSINRYSNVGAKDKAFTVLAELYLMQHSCHWFCKTKRAASRRLLRRHRTAYAKVLASVMPATHHAYTTLVCG